MEHFLLNVVLILLIVIALLGFILRIVFRIGTPYAGAMLPTAPVGNHSGNGGFFLFSVVVLLGILGYHYFKRGIDPPISDNNIYHEQTRQQIDQPDDYEGHVIPEENESSKSSKEDSRKLKVNRYEDYYEDHQPEISRYNQSPRHQLDDFHAIQIAAYVSPNLARAAYHNLSSQVKDLRIIYLPTDEIPFRLAIGEFISKSEAEEHKKRHRLEGIIKHFTY